MEEIKAKTMLSAYQKDSQWFGHHYNLNIYKGCSHGCIYCDSRSECYRIDNFDEVKAKENALLILEKELKTKRKKGVIGSGAMSDPYNPQERIHQLTRKSLILIDKYQFGVSLTTKSSLIERDLDILLEIKKHSAVLVLMTITTADDLLASMIEPGASKTSERFETLRKLSSANIATGILMMPILPFINDTEENVSSIISKASQCGVRYIYPAFGVTLRQNQRDYYFEQLDKKFPGIKQKTMQAFNDRYVCTSPNAHRLSRVFEQLCKESNIITNMKQIIADYQSEVQSEQLKLF
ncbi:MAG: radical SAM protein [Firmicutes bacterium HGW-Firmicutes-20]|jgi:DNA repair photolyase|nr:MAG: radical SAM protein [Firmicutes bacterium HGW-Firmicutes-20]PKM68254.1 MAG: radical SAM protein [Firmicutes bacterium HGW-Firmicutes-19]